MVPADKSLDSFNARMAPAHPQQRREIRYTVALEIEASGIRDGEVFHERTFTQNVSDWGCGFWMMLELKPEDMVMVRKTSRDPAKTSQPSQSLFQVMRVVRKDDRWLVGA
jgi:hypothetical protein